MVARVPLAELTRAARPGLRSVRVRPFQATNATEIGLYVILSSVLGEWDQFIRTDLMQLYNPPPELVFTDSDGMQIRWLIEQREADINNRVIYQTDTLRRWVTRFGQWHRTRTAAAVYTATGVRVEDFIRMEDVRNVLDSSIVENVSLIRGLSTETRRNVERIIFEGFALRRTRLEISRSLSRALGVTRERARRIAADQTSKINTLLNEFRQQQLGFDKYVWLTRRDRRVRPEHMSRDGGVFLWAKPPNGGHPGYAVNCRCLAEAYMELY